MGVACGRGLWAWLGAWSAFPSLLSLADHMSASCDHYNIETVLLSRY